MSFAIVKGELCSCSCNFVSVMLENSDKKRKILKGMTKRMGLRNFAVQLYFWLGHGRKFRRM